MVEVMLVTILHEYMLTGDPVFFMEIAQAYSFHNTCNLASSSSPLACGHSHPLCRHHELGSNDSRNSRSQNLPFGRFAQTSESRTLDIHAFSHGFANIWQPLASGTEQIQTQS